VNGEARWFAAAACIVAGCAELEAPDVETTEAALTLPAVVDLDVDPSGAAPTGWQMFGWTPDFSVNVPGFDSLNRAYIRDRTSFLDEIPGTMKQLRFGAWEERSFDGAVRTALGCTAEACKVCYDGGSGEYNAQIVLDRHDRAYTVVQAFALTPEIGTDPAACPLKPPAGAVRNLLLRSAGPDQPWVVETLPCAEQFALERPWSPEALEGPPAVLLNDTSAAYCGGTTPGVATLTVVKPSITGSGNGTMTLASRVLQPSEAMSIGGHSGGGTQVLTQNGLVYAAWGVRAASGGSPVIAATWNPQSGAFFPYSQSDMFSLPLNNGHNRPALAMDSTGILHLVIGTHQCAFRYLRSTSPYSVNGFTAAQPTIPHLGIDDCPRATGEEGQTYIALVRDRFDVLHLVYRLYQPPMPGKPEGYYLVQQRKAAAANVWEDLDPTSAVDRVRTLVDPPHALYSIYYHQLTIDHRGRLYLLFSWYSYAGCEEDDPVCGPPGSWFGLGQSYKYNALLVSADGGDSWQFGSTASFDDATFWEPASGVLADVDGNSLKDVVHAYWDHGFELHIDGAHVLEGVWQWVTRGRRGPDGAQILQRPVLAGHVNVADTREDLVFIYNQPDLRIRSQLARADGGFDIVEQSDGAFAPDPAYPILMGDVTGDQLADLVMPYWSNNCLNIRTKVGTGNGTWTTSTATCVATSRMSTYAAKLGRIDGDQRRDLVFLWRDAGGPLKSRVLRSGAGAGGAVTWTATAEQTHGDGSGIHLYPHLLGDVNGDGFDDLVFLFQHWDTKNFSVRVKFAHGNGYGWSGSRETQHPDGDQIPHFPPMIGKVNADACADLVFPHRLGIARRGHYQVRTFLAACDGASNPGWTRHTTRLP
jgi:hypothetical protein